MSENHLMFCPIFLSYDLSRFQKICICFMQISVKKHIPKIAIWRASPNVRLRVSLNGARLRMKQSNSTRQLPSHPPLFGRKVSCGKLSWFARTSAGPLHLRDPADSCRVASSFCWSPSGGSSQKRRRRKAPQAHIPRTKIQNQAVERKIGSLAPTLEEFGPPSLELVSVRSGPWNLPGYTRATISYVDCPAHRNGRDP